MSLTLGEKLREAREERGFSLGEVSEQTRISSLYLESIENDDYRPLPGGIFNKGFVRSYAKFVGIDEQEALADYASLLSQSQGSEVASPVPYRPEVLTDDRSSSSIPTIILATVILAAMTGGILYLVNYMRRPPEEIVAANTHEINQNVETETLSNSNSNTGAKDSPDMSAITVEFKAVTEPVSLTATNDGKTTSSLLSPGESAKFEPKQSLKLSYSKSLAQAVRLEINGKDIALPLEPLEPRRNAIEFEISEDNLAQIWKDGAINKIAPVAEPEQSPVAESIPSAEPSATAEAEATSTPIHTRTPAPIKPKPVSNTADPKPSVSPKISETPKPAPTRPVVVIRSANRPDQGQR